MADPREERLWDIIAALSPFLASVVLSSIPTNAKVAYEIFKMYVDGILRRGNHKASLGYKEEDKENKYYFGGFICMCIIYA